jgi:hypothetical protein
LPTAYDDSLSYYETILKLLNLMIALAEADADVVHWTELNPILDQIDKAITSLQNQINAANQRITDLKAYFDADQIRQTKELKDYTDSVTAMIRSELAGLIAAGDAANKAYIDWQITKIMELINELVCRFNRGIFDPTSGKCEDVGIVVNRVYHWLRYRAQTVTEFDGNGLTAQQLDAVGYTAKEFDLYSKEILQFDFNHGGFSPVTGELCSYQIMIEQLVNFHRSDWNAGGFDAKEYTAQTFDDLGWTAYYFDFTNYTAA